MNPMQEPLCRAPRPLAVRRLVLWILVHIFLYLCFTDPEYPDISLAAKGTGQAKVSVGSSVTSPVVTTSMTATAV